MRMQNMHFNVLCVQTGRLTRVKRRLAPDNDDSYDGIPANVPYHRPRPSWVMSLNAIFRNQFQNLAVRGRSRGP